MTKVPSIPKLTLFSIFPFNMLLGQKEAGTIAKPTDNDELQKLWNKANAEFVKLDPNRALLTNDDIRPLVLKDKDKLAKMIDRLSKYQPYSSHNFGIYDVNARKLITPQLSVNLNRANSRANIRKEMSMDELFDISFDLSANRPEIVRQILGIGPNGGSIQFTSYDEDIRVHSPPQFVNLPVNEKDPSGPSLESASFLIGGGYPFTVAYKIQINPTNTILIIGNGIHRVYGMIKAGYQRIPIAVVDLNPMEIQNPFVDMPKEMLLGPNPPMLTDFTNENVIIPLEYYTQLKTLRLSWNVENYTTVLK